MSAVYESLLENSIKAILSSIEIYNKPDFKYREQIFVIICVNAWELLLKAKILKDAGGNLASLYVSQSDGSYKVNRTGNPLTIEITSATRKLSLNNVVTENLERLIELRDTSVHFYHDEAIAYLVYTLGVAALRNYQKLVNEWFGRSLLEYNFYILPLGFAYSFKTLSILELERKPDVISKLIASVSSTQSSLQDIEGFHFICELTTQVVSAKKFTEIPDFVTMIDSSGNPSTLVIERLQRLTDKYPLSYTELCEIVRKTKPDHKQHHINEIIKNFRVKDNPRLSGYNFRTKAQQEVYEKTGKLPLGVPSIYNLDAVRFIIEELSKLV